MALEDPFPDWPRMVATLRELAPADFPPSLPIYGVSKEQIFGADCCVRWAACTSNTFSTKYRYFLESHRAWQGDGPFVIFNKRSFRAELSAYHDPLSTLLHEAAHYLEERILHTIDDSTGHSFRDLIGDFYTTIGATGDHSVLWSRCAAHLWHRASSAGFRVSLEQICGSRGGADKHSLSVNTLMEELQSFPSRSSIQLFVMLNDPGESYRLFWGLPYIADAFERTVQQACHYPGKVWN